MRDPPWLTDANFSCVRSKRPVFGRCSGGKRRGSGAEETKVDDVGSDGSDSVYDVVRSGPPTDLAAVKEAELELEVLRE